MNLNSSSRARSVMAATRARPAAGSRNSSTNFMRAPRWKSQLDDRGGVERLDLVVVRLAHLFDGFEGEIGLPLVDLGHRETDVDQHPIALGDPVLSQQSHADRSLNAADVDLGQVVVRVD